MVKSRDPKTLADGICRLFDDEGYRHSLEAKALARARERFSLGAMVGEYREIYKELTEASKVRRMALPGPEVEA